jgi:Transposase zinc-ribbon domain
METLSAFDRRFPTEESCKDFLAAQRWPDGVRCPRCNRKEKVYAIKPYQWRCRNADCGGRNGYKFSVITHTIFQDTKIPLKLWWRVAYFILTSKKGMSALQVHRVIFGEDSGHDYRTTWYMCTRWRAAMKGVLESVQARHHRFVSQSQQRISAAVRERICVALQQSQESTRIRGFDYDVR